jgi:YidC/Oxa1 family membrane protein insertase
MTDMRRTILWVVFSVSLVLLWDAWNKHNGNPSMFSPTPVKTAASAGAAPGASAVLPAGLPTAAGAATAGAPIAPVAAAPTATEKLTITTDVIKATLDSKGGDLVRLELLKYSDAADAKRNLVLFDHSAQRVYLAQTGLISSQAGVSLPNHFTVMQALPGERTLQDGAKELSVSFESPEIGGVKLVKTYTFHRGEYTIGVKHELRNVSAAAVSPQLYLQLTRDGNPPPGESSFYSTFTGPAMYAETSKYHKIDFKSIEKAAKDGTQPDHDKTSGSGWVAMVQHYFASAWLANDKIERAFSVSKVSDNLYAITMVLPLGEVAPGATKSFDATLFAGPQEEKKLEALAPGLELVKDYGWLTILSKPLYWLLDQLHKLLGNWGWAIVALVVLLKIAFYALNAHAYKSMAKMKAINPKVTEMRERYKDKPQQMQQEMMRIYREEKVNPLGGCLPIFVQMPFFIALYWVLLSTVEMRNAPWIGWIHDLSTRDPFFILPLLMTASTMFQTWLNPTPPDPVQAKMMWIMPLMFSVMFFFFPAGLVLYWLTNNILGIAQQWFINKRLGVA